MHGYAEDLAAIHAAGFTDLARAAAKELLGRLSAPARVVELGCGDGTTARLLCEAGHVVHGIDASPAMIALARRRAPHASFAVGSFVDSDLPDQCDGRCARALRSGGLLMFDLAGPGREGGSPRRTWAEGPDWAVLVETQVVEDQLTRQIISFRDLGNGQFQRSHETHRLLLHRPSDVLRRLRAAGFTARTLADGYASAGLPHGLTAYVAHRRPAAR